MATVVFRYGCEAQGGRWEEDMCPVVCGRMGTILQEGGGRTKEGLIVTRYMGCRKGRRTGEGGSAKQKAR